MKRLYVAAQSSAPSVFGKRAAAVLLIASLLFTFTACKKKTDKISTNAYASGRVIQETDPFFNAEINELKIPLDNTKEFKSFQAIYCVPMWEYLICEYSVEYKYPKKMKSIFQMSEEEYDEYTQYQVRDIGIFNMRGELIKKIGGDIDTVFTITSDENGDIYLLGYVHDSFYSVNNIEVHILDQKRNFKESIILKDPPVAIPGTDPISSGDDLIGMVEFDFTSVFSSRPGAESVRMQILKDGSILTSKKGEMKIYNRDGSKRCDVIDPDRILEENAFLKGEKYYVLSTVIDEENGRSVQIKELNTATGALGQGKEAVALSKYYSPVVTEKGIFIDSFNGCFEYDMDSDSVKEVFNWNDTDVNRAILMGVRCQPESADELDVVAFDEEQKGPYLIHLMRAEKNPHAGKKIIRIGGVNISGELNLMNFIYQYNADPEGKTRAVIIDYTADQDILLTSADTERKIYMEILSGEGPDILVNMGSSEMFRNGRIMEDLNQYMDGPEGIDRNLYYDNVFRACERDGKLYHVPIDFTLEGLMVNTDLISNRKGWTYEEFVKAAESLPEDVNILPSTRYNDLLRPLLQASLTRFMNYQDQTVNFQNEEMKKILNLVRDYGVKEIPPYEAKRVDTTELGGGSLSQIVVDYSEEKLQEGLIAAKDVSISFVHSIAYQGRLLRGKVGFLGYPSYTGTGMFISPVRTLGILSSGNQKDLAWEVIRAYLEFEGADPHNYAIPVNREIFEKQCQVEMDRYNQQYKESIEMFGSASAFEVEIHTEDIDMLRTLVENADTASFQDESVFTVITEEAAGFFAGDRTAEDVLSIIQNRTKLIVTET